MNLTIQLLTSALTFLGMWLAGRKDWRGWLVGLVNQVCWLAVIVTTDAWGILPLSVGLTVIYTRNLVRWRRDERELLAVAG